MNIQPPLPLQTQQTPAKDQTQTIELEVLTQAICASLRPSLGQWTRLQCSNQNGLLPISHLFSHHRPQCSRQMASELRPFPCQEMKAMPHAISQLAQAVEQKIYCRLMTECERKGYRSGRLPW